MVTLSLGSVIFQGFEIPPRLRLGGRQALAVHKLPGGVRVVDAMGRDDSDLSWSGYLSGANAGPRARLLDAVRASGAVLPLSWDAFAYSVIISRLELDYCSPWWIAYRIDCTVVADRAQGMPATAPDLVTGLLDDLTAASGFLDLTSATAALSASGALVTGTQANQAAVGALSAAEGGIGSGISNAELGMQSADISSLVGSSQSLAQLCCAQGFVERAAANLGNAGD